MKPVIEFNNLLSDNPSKNYILNLMAVHLATLNPSRALDAGCGALRNFWMFSGKYVGIGLNRSDFVMGLRNPPNPEVIAKRGMPEMYLMRLESDFSFLGKFDIAVCTFCMTLYFEDRGELVRRLGDRVVKGGSIMLDGWADDLPGFLDHLKATYQHVEVVPWGLEELNQRFHGATPEELVQLTSREMNAPEDPDLYSRYYLLGVGKKEAAVAPGPRPDIRDDNGINVVVADIPRLQMD